MCVKFQRNIRTVTLSLSIPTRNAPVRAATQKRGARQDARSRQNNHTQYFRLPELIFFAGRVVPLDAIAHTIRLPPDSPHSTANHVIAQSAPQ